MLRRADMDLHEAELSRTRRSHCEISETFTEWIFDPFGSRERDRNRRKTERHAARPSGERRCLSRSLTHTGQRPVADTVREHRCQTGLLIRSECNAVVVGACKADWFELALEYVLGVGAAGNNAR